MLRITCCRRRHDVHEGRVPVALGQRRVDVLLAGRVRPGVDFMSQFRPEIAIKLHQGVDVMITIFSDFRQFSAKKLAFFSKTNVMIKILHNLALFLVKNAIFFAEFFGVNR
jgi:hypothetical protein